MPEDLIPLTHKKLNAVKIHPLLYQGSINEHNYALHSFRISAATTAVAAAVG